MSQRTFSLTDGAVLSSQNMDWRELLDIVLELVQTTFHQIDEVQVLGDSLHEAFTGAKLWEGTVAYRGLERTTLVLTHPSALLIAMQIPHAAIGFPRADAIGALKRHFGLAPEEVPSEPEDLDKLGGALIAMAKRVRGEG